MFKFLFLFVGRFVNFTKADCLIKFFVLELSPFLGLKIQFLYIFHHNTHPSIPILFSMFCVANCNKNTTQIK